MANITGTNLRDIIVRGYGITGTSTSLPSTTDLIDMVFGGDGDDLIEGAGGNDMLYGEAGNDIIFGGEGNDVLEGGDGADFLFGGNGNDTLIGGATSFLADDNLAGGDGDDTYVVSQFQTLITEYENAGYDTVMSSITRSLGAGSEIEALTLTGSGNTEGRGNELDNVVTGNIGDNFLRGREGDDTILGGDGHDILEGDEGNDMLDGGAGVDTLQGSMGIDILRGGSGDDYITADQNDSLIDGGTGANDTVRYESATPAVNLNLATGIASFAGLPSQSVIGIENAELAAFNDIFTGTAGVNVVSGGDGNDRIFGGGGEDNLAGEAGNDLLDGGLGADMLSGGQGDDTFFVDRTTDFITENAGEGFDTVKSTVSLTLGFALENLTLFGTANQNGFGNELDNTIAGNSANNVLRGLDGRDTIRGGAGDDRLVGDDGQNIDFTLWRTQDGGNGHGYAVVAAPGGIDANAALDAARALGGTLASITSAEENSFVFGLTNDSRYWSPDNVLGPWLGGAQPLAAQEPGEFRWVDGEQFNFTAWAPGEPSNGGGVEDRIQFFQRLTNPGSWNDLAAASTAVVAYVVEFDDPNAFNDSLDGGAGDDMLSGNIGADRLTGGLGRDTLTGGSQADIFAFNTILESTVGANRDIVTDFEGAGAAGGDRIDLRAIDANTGLAGDQAFAFIGIGAFSGAGQIQAIQSGNTTFIRGNIDADLAADFEIQVNGLHGFLAVDFLL